MGSEQQAFDFLDLLTIFSVALQVDQTIKLQEQASNDDLLKALQESVDILNSKLDRLLQLAEDSSRDAGKRLSSAQ